MLGAKKALAKRVSRSDTSRSGSPTLLKTEEMPAAVAEVAILKLGTSNTRPVRRSMCASRKS